jgi:hypothetical protein
LLGRLASILSKQILNGQKVNTLSSLFSLAGQVADRAASFGSVVFVVLGWIGRLG